MLVLRLCSNESIEIMMEEYLAPLNVKSSLDALLDIFELLKMAKNILQIVKLADFEPPPFYQKTGTNMISILTND